MAMDGALDHAFGFNDAIPLQIACASQHGIEDFWAKLAAHGGKADPCGWLQDPLGRHQKS